ncbi:hypothetical protein GCM10027155_17860 [Acinetobacter apis]|nr:PilC/PilY family type IV pilus protein [Acinetobacter apis]
MIPSVAVHSSDIEIYKTAESIPTLMMMLDISGSMSAYQVGTDACDPPTGYRISSTDTNIYQESGTTERPYVRVYCQGETTTLQRNYYIKVEQKYYRGFFGLLYADGPPIYYQCGVTGRSTLIEDCKIVLTRTPNLRPYKFTSTGTVNLVNTTYYYLDETTPEKIYDRITKVKDGMYDLLQGSDSITPLSDEKVIGLSNFSYNADGRRGYVSVPARRLDDVVSTNGRQTITQRDTLLTAVANLVARGGTPTAHAYAETAAYLMGTTTVGATYSGFTSSASNTRSGTNYVKPASLSADNASCSSQGIYVLTDGEPNNSSTALARNIMQPALGSKQSGLTCTSSLLSAGTSDTSAWLCIADFSQLLLDKNKNPLGRQIKTAVVGFGKDFQSIPSYDKGKSEAFNIASIDASTGSVNVKNTAKWGIYAKGRWYSGTNSKDVVDSFKAFVNEVDPIPPVTTGAATVPSDNLNPLALVNKAYFSQFIPTPDKNFQLWLGNLKLYKVTNGVLKTKNNLDVLKDGLIINQYDEWAESERDAVGGTAKNLPLRLTGDNLNRTIWTDRAITAEGVKTDETSLRKLNLTLVTNSSGATSDPDRGYLLSALGFAVDLNGLPKNLAQLKQVAELRQMGALLHSSPILLTNQGKVQVSSGKVTTSNREDYVLFGTTQGLLHVVDAGTGIEKFAFLPNEMMNSQKKAFLFNEMVNGGISNLFYGIDAPWTNYTEYVTKNSSTGEVTVGTGENNTQGKQYVYGGLRMGGRSYYALNLSDMNNPSILFHIDPQTQRIYSKNTDVFGTLYPELQYMGQSWSKPSVNWIRWNNEKRLVMFLGGGYDAGGSDGNGVLEGEEKRYEGYESATYNQTNKKGAGVYMFDAITGQLLWWTGANATKDNTSANVKYTTAPNMEYSVVSQIRTVDRNLDGLVDHLYFGDLGGQVWRIDLNNSAPSLDLFAKEPVRLLNLNNRQYSPRFYEMPAFSIYRAANSSVFAAISVGSGNRSSPLFTTTNSSYLDDSIYNIFDRDVARSNLFDTVKSEGSSTYTYSAAAKTMVSQDISLKSSNAATKMVPFKDANTSASGGWYYAWKSPTNGLQSVKVIQMPIVVSNDLFVPTFNSAASGIAGACGGGVQGQSRVTSFCMPYGKCSLSNNYDSEETLIGAGLVTASVTGDPTNTETNGSTVTGGSGSRVFLNQAYNRNNKFFIKAWREVNP